MKSNLYTFIICIVYFLLSQNCLKASDSGILKNKVNVDVVQKITSSIDSWRVNKREQYFKALENLPHKDKSLIIGNAEVYLEYDWPTLKAIDFLQYKTNGNRTIYESQLNKRREVFETLVKAELVERKERFIPQIINGLWLILEESTWVSPAHLPTQKLGLGLPNIEDPYIDLGAGRQGVSVSLVYFLLSESFDKYSKHINVRILHELNHRIIDPYLTREDYWWMSYKSDFINNWNIWINTNVLKTFLLIESDKTRLAAGILKVMASADRFIDFYPEDGACEEGPSYWSHAGGELGSMLKWITDVSGGSISFTGQKKLKNIGAYILNTRIAENVYVNFADAFAIENVLPIKVWNFYLVFGEEDFRSFSAYLANRNEFNSVRQGLHDLLEFSSVRKEIFESSSNIVRPNYYFYKSLGQVIINNVQNNNSMFFSAIGSHNDVSHNHNDVGSFMLYYNATPVLIDVGVGTYNSKTFSSKRYEIWNMQSQYHNLPIINGVQQKDGSKFKATHVKSSQNDKEYTYSVNIAKAYPDIAAVDNWIREFRINKRQNTLVVSENYTLREIKSTQQIVFMTKFKPMAANKEIEIVLDNDQKAIFNFKTKPKEIKIEEILVDDKRIERVWGEKVYRVIVEVDVRSKVGKTEYSIKFVK